MHCVTAVRWHVSGHVKSAVTETRQLLVTRWLSTVIDHGAQGRPVGQNLEWATLMQIVLTDFVILKLRIHQNAPFQVKNSFFRGEGIAPLPRPIPWWEGSSIPAPHPSPSGPTPASPAKIPALCEWVTVNTPLPQVCVFVLVDWRMSVWNKWQKSISSKP